MGNSPQAPPEHAPSCLEKLFTVQAIHNHQNDRVCARQKENIPVELSTAFRRQKPPSVMVWAGVTTDGRKTPLVFIEEGVKIDQAVYLHLMSETVYGDVWGGSMVFQHDEALSHTAKSVQQWCMDIFPGFWGKDMWPPSSLISIPWTLAFGPFWKPRPVPHLCQIWTLSSRISPKPGLKSLLKRCVPWPPPPSTDSRLLWPPMVDILRDEYVIFFPIFRLNFYINNIFVK
jgi:hypothetical protein